MVQIVLVLVALLLSASFASAAEAWVTYGGGEGPGRGKSVVLVSGDEEYRSEEALPQLGKILSAHHGFECRVVFAIDPQTGLIDPNVRTNIPGLDALADADLMIIATRFRDLPDEQMAHIDAYLKSGRPVVGLRTATHAFALEGSPTYRRYSWNHDGANYLQGFGRQVLGESWIAHHGAHGRESTRGVAAPWADDHPIMRGIEPGSIWGPTDVYRVRLPLPDGCTPVVVGEVLVGMKPDDPPVAGPKNDPMMPVAWTKVRAGAGKSPERVFTTTMGAATDLVAEGTRRMLVNGVYWALGMEDAIPAGGTTVDLVGPYAPSDYAFGGFRRDVDPQDHALPVSGEKDEPPPAPADGSVSLAPGDRIVVVGNTFAERLAQSGVFDAIAHAAHPEHRLEIRHVPWSADEVGLRPREMNVPTMEDWLARLEADVVFLCFGMSESFGGGAPERFEADLRALVASVRSRAGDTVPRIVLVSPIAHEVLGAPWPAPDAVAAHNASLAAVTAAGRRVAEAAGHAFVDLFAFSRAAYGEIDAPLTANGIHPTERGCAVFAGELARQLDWIGAPSSREPIDAMGVAAAADALRALACDKHYYFRLRYRPTNTEYVWGRRHEPYGVVNFPPEMAQLDRMVAARERAIWAMDKPSPEAVVTRAMNAPPMWPHTPSDRTFPEDRWTPAPVAAKGSETSLGSVEIDDPETFTRSFTLPGDYVIECFASEQDFPELANPLAMAFDDRHRLWVLCTPTYPHLLPGEKPRCTLLILEDRDGDGRADARTVFADGLYIPTGFAIDTDAVYVGQAPDLLRLVDDDGDDRADRREIVLSGFGMCDSHHQISAFEWDPSGGFLFHEGVFTKSNVETPYGTRRTDGASVWRLDPRTQRLEVLAHCYFNNPWGHVYDDFGASILADASAGENFVFSQVSLPFTYPSKPQRVDAFLIRGRPTAGCELIGSRQFPEDVQGSFLVNQSIGFHGTRWDRLSAAGSGWSTASMPQDLIACDDLNFRPVAMEIGPDGALYVVDWCNPIVGHMQYSVRDPRRDHAHGRVWRLGHRHRPLVQPPDVHGASVPELLELLRLPERNTRQLARRRLQRAGWSVIGPALTTWGAGLDPRDPLYGRLVLEDLWIRHAYGRVNPDLIERGLALDEPRARAGVVRVLRHLLQAGDIDSRDAAPLLARAVEDADMRVRLDAVVACGFMPAEDGVPIAARADLHDMDDPMHAVFTEVLTQLGSGGDVASEVLERVRLERMAASDLLAQPMTDLGATVRVARADVPRESRAIALAHLAGDDPARQIARLLTLVETVRGDDAVRAVGEMLLAMPDRTLQDAGDEARALTADEDPTRRAIGTAMLMRAGAVIPPAPELVPALAMMEAGSAPAAAVDQLREAVDAQTVAPGPAIEQAVRHATGQAELRGWLVGLVDVVADEGLEPWTADHERAMAALRGLQQTGDDAWFAEHERYRVEPAPDEVRDAGRALYHHEATGCARCHGVRGQGLEGFPPLARSPWLLGDARRAASIVVHGLYGAITMHDGRKFNSAMEPLGDNLDDEEIAAILTYARGSWGNFAAPVSAAQVVEARAAAPRQGGAWEARALLAKYPPRRDGLIPEPPAPERSWMAVLVRQLVVYLVPPLAAAAAILFLLSRSSLD